MPRPKAAVFLFEQFTTGLAFVCPKAYVFPFERFTTGLACLSVTREIMENIRVPIALVTGLGYGGCEHVVR